MAKLDIYRINENQLSDYVSNQVANLFPDGLDIQSEIDKHIGESLHRLQKCINSIRVWRDDYFDPFHSSQYCTFLYFLANTIWKSSGNVDVPTRLFLLNKALNGIDLYFEIDLPPIFFIGHSVGIVLAKAKYGNHLVIYQNSTVGKNHGVAPCLEDGVILYPNTAVIGSCIIGAGSVISQGVSVVNQNTEPGSVVYRGNGQQLVFKKQKFRILDDFFNDAI